MRVEDYSPPARVPTANVHAVGTLSPAPQAFADLVWAWLREPDADTAWGLFLDLPDGDVGR